METSCKLHCAVTYPDTRAVSSLKSTISAIHGHHSRYCNLYEIAGILPFLQGITRLRSACSVETRFFCFSFRHLFHHFTRSRLRSCVSSSFRVIHKKTSSPDRWSGRTFHLSVGSCLPNKSAVDNDLAADKPGQRGSRSRCGTQ